MRYLRLHIFCFVAGIMFFAKSMAQVTFKYDEVTICEGDSYNLLNFQTDEVIVPVGWEIIGWQGVANTTVLPTVSPTVYTLEYRETDNPSVVLTKNLTIYLYPKPTVSITPSGKQTLCEGEPIHIEKVSAENYDRLFWLYVEGDERYTTDAIDAVANLNHSNRMTYKLLATNKNCPAFLAEAEVSYAIVENNVNKNYVSGFELSTIPNTNNGAIRGHAYGYCADVKLSDYVTPKNVVCDLGALGVRSLPLNGENELMRVTRFEIVWDNNDAYTAGAPLSEQYYYNTFTIQVEVYMKGCGLTKTYSEKRYIQLTYGCDAQIELIYNCYKVRGIGEFRLNYENIERNDIVDVIFENKTLPGKYIPRWNGNAWNGPISGFYRIFSITWDENAPLFMLYDVSITFLAADGSLITKNFTDIGVETCQPESGLYYRIRRAGSYLQFTSMANLGCAPTAQEPWCVNFSTTSATTIVKKICKSECTFFVLSTPTGGDWVEVIWDNLDFGNLAIPLPCNQQHVPIPATAYQSGIVDGKYFQRIKKDWFDSAGGAAFMLCPKETTTYSGTVYGVPFSLRVEVEGADLAVMDTAICQGESIDLKTLELANNVDGLVEWAVGNETVVSPQATTSYLLYGIPKFPCPASNAGQVIEANVTLSVDSRIWATKKDFSVCAGDQIRLGDWLNTNGRKITWYDEQDKELPMGIAEINAKATFRVEISNACETIIETLTVDVDPYCPPASALSANDDRVKTTSCANRVVDRIEIPVLDNDVVPSIYSFITIITPPSIQGNTAAVVNDIIVYTANSNMAENNVTPIRIDSIQYELDVNGQKDSAWVYVEIEKHPMPVIENLFFDETELFFQVSGGTPPFTYTLDGTTTSPYPAFSNITEFGIYHVQVSDAHGCSSSARPYKGSPYMKAKNDTIHRIACAGIAGTVIVAVLDNDSLTCDPRYSEIQVLYSSFPSYRIAGTALNRTININYSFNGAAKDSLQYEIACDEEKDTAWVYMIVEEKYPAIINLIASTDSVRIEIDMPEDGERRYFFLYSEDFSVDEYARTSTTSHTFENLSLPDGKYYVDACYSNCCVTDSFVLKRTPPTFPDNVTQIDCYTSVEASEWSIRMSEILPDRIDWIVTPLVGDLDNDGLPEIVVVRTDWKNNGAGVHIYKGGDFSQVNRSINFPMGSNPNGTSFGYSALPIAIARIPSYDNPPDTVGIIYLFTMDSNGTKKLRSYIYNDINDVQPFKTVDLENFGSAVSNTGSPALADFNQDGHPEVYIGNQVFDAYTLEKIGSAPTENHGLRPVHDVTNAFSFAADVLPGNPGLELLCGNQVFSVKPEDKPNGVKLLLTVGGTKVEGSSQAVDLNGDGKLDVVVKTATALAAYCPETNEILLAPSTTFTAHPTIGDIDGCGLPEIVGLISGSQMAAYKYDAVGKSLTEFWRISHTDISYRTSMTLFDFNQDGLKEIVYRDEKNLRIINGSGKSHITHNDTLQGGRPVVYDLSSIPIASATKDEYPVIADIDNDGQAEILVSGDMSASPSNGTSNVYIFKSNGAAWAPARPVWNQFQYDVVNVNKDLTIPRQQFNVATTMPNGKQVFNNFLEQATWLNQNGDMYAGYHPDTTRIDTTIKWGESYIFNGKTLTEPTRDTLELKNAAGCDSLIVLNLDVDMPKIKAVNDTVQITPCQYSFIVNVIANDTLPCTNPQVRVLDAPFPYTRLTLSGTNLIYYPDIDVDDYPGQTDSVRYSVSCGSVVDTAWVFFQYPPSLDPWIEIESRFNKECFAVGDTIVEDILITRRDYQNCSALNNTYFSYSLSSPMATFLRISATGTMINDSTELLKISYRVQSINSGYGSTLTTTTAIYAWNPYLGYYLLLNHNRTTDLSICNEITMTDCEISATFPVTHAGARAYRLSQRAQLPGAVDAISQDGIISYSSPWVTDITRDSLKYEVDLQGGRTVGGTIFITILPCIDSTLVSTTINNDCNYDSCRYEGPSILINEAMITPEKYDGAIYGYQCDSTEAKGGEWVELYNPDKCNEIDISGYFMANSTSDSPLCNGVNVRGIGAAFVLPEGTVIPPMGFCVLRGNRAIVVDSARLVENGGNTVVINLMDYFDRFCLDNTGNRFWLPNAGGWFGFYDRDGVPQDAIWWGADRQDICSDCHPCNPQLTGTYAGVLASLNGFPADRKSRVSDVGVGIWEENTPKRIPDGGDWTFNDFTPSTIGYCNDICNTRANSECTGTASAEAYGGTGSFSYQWDDPWHQNTAVATGLCEGVYYCTIRDINTGLTRVVRAVVENICINAVDDIISIVSCRDTTIRISVLHNDFYTCDKPEIFLLSDPVSQGNTAQIVDDLLVFHLRNIDERDSLQYKIVCDGTRLIVDSAWVFINVDKDTLRSNLAITLCIGDSTLFAGIYHTETGTYRDTLPEGVNSCSSITTLYLTVRDSSRIILEPDNQYICQDGEQEITLTVKVRTGNPSEIAWYDDDRTPIEPDRTSSKRYVIPLDSESTYWAYAIDPVCGDSPYAYTTVYITNKIYLLLQADTNKVQMGDKAILTVTPTNDEHGIYRWYDAFTGKLLGETTVNTFAYTLDDAGIYMFYVLTDNGYCPDAQSNNVEVEARDYYMIPDIITPYNQNGLNDTFMTPRDGKPGYRVEIYNRYQQKVFEGDNGWDGTYRGQLAEPGTYFFRIFMKDGRVLKGPLEVAKF